MDIHFAGFVVFDFLPQTREKELHVALEELYGDEAEEYRGGMFGGSGTWPARLWEPRGQPARS